MQRYYLIIYLRNKETYFYSSQSTIVLQLIHNAAGLSIPDGVPHDGEVSDEVKMIWGPRRSERGCRDLLYRFSHGSLRRVLVQGGRVAQWVECLIHWTFFSLQ